MRSFLAPAVLLLLAAAPARAQTPDSAGVNGDTAWIHSVLDDACPGGRVRLYRGSGGPVHGRCGPVMDGRLLVRDADATERAVELRNVREVWVLERQTGQGALIGAGLGAGALILAGSLLVSALCETDDCSGDYVTVFAVGTLVGGGAGSLLGGAIGYLTKGWERKYP
jgi:hypothetical protein